ncbi:MAG TPA: VTT domain-containing protein [Armatimonadota bacterium]|nr:VTT domain-containing protein [Armatimonadota bacterium]
MEAIRHFFDSLHGKGLENLIQSGGLLLLFAIVFAETGLLVGFFLPGDSLLFVAGFLVGIGRLKAPIPMPDSPFLSLFVLQGLLMLAAFIGNSTGYWVGSKAGPALFNRPNSRIFRREYLLKTQELWEKHGGKTIILAEFMPFARTFAPVVAGIAQMPYRRFITFNLIGVVVWIFSMTTLGYWLGRIDWVSRNLEKAILLVILISLSPAILHVVKDRLKARKKAADPAEPAESGPA